MYVCAHLNTHPGAAMITEACVCCAQVRDWHRMEEEEDARNEAEVSLSAVFVLLCRAALFRTRVCVRMCAYMHACWRTPGSPLWDSHLGTLTPPTTRACAQEKRRAMAHGADVVGARTRLTST